MWKPSKFWGAKDTLQENSDVLVWSGWQFFGLDEEIKFGYFLVSKDSVVKVLWELAVWCQLDLGLTLINWVVLGKLLTGLSLSFLICKVGTVLVPILGLIMKSKWDNGRKMISSVWHILQIYGARLLIVKKKISP